MKARAVASIRGATDEPISPAIERRAAQRTVLAHETRGWCTFECWPDPAACKQLPWARSVLGLDEDQAAASAAGGEETAVVESIRHITNARTVTGQWFKSSKSGPNCDNCVEFAKTAEGGIAVRNSREPGGPALVFTPGEIAAMLAGARDGEFDHLVLS